MTYTVVAGDSLGLIAQKLLGDANRWQEIFQANTDKISNPDLIYVGQVLTIPQGNTLPAVVNVEQATPLDWRAWLSDPKKIAILALLVGGGVFLFFRKKS